MNKPTFPPTQQEEPPGLSEDQEREHAARHRPRRRWLWLTACAVLAVVVLYFLLRSHQSSSASQAGAGRGPAAVPVTAATAHTGDIGVYYTGLGAVTPLYTVTVKSRVDGQLMKVYYKEGQTVRQGAPLVEIDPRPYEVQLTQAQGQLIKDQANLQNARVDLARYQELIKRNAVAEQQLATQQATVTQDEGAVKTDQGLIDSAKLNLVYCHINSPITGRVGLRLVDPGNIVLAASNTGLMVIAQIEPISVIFTISEDQLPPVVQKFRAGQKLQVDAYDRDLKKKLSQGTLLTMDNQIDPTTGTLRLRAIFDNKDDALFPNQFVNARLLVEEKHGVTLVPTAAIQRNSQKTFVYLVKPDQTVTVRNITLGTTEGDEAEIASGLAPGDVVVTTGVDKLQEGSKVNAQITDGKPPRPGS
ncbi:MAG: MdtA/MuxA family multidrug efflux RND transporter periplasmic adaptor subunit [Terriglobales bacterium]